MSLKSKRFAFTINETETTLIPFSDDQFSSWFNQITAKKANHIKYLIIGREIGEQGRRHLQGYVEFTNAITLPTLKQR